MLPIYFASLDGTMYTRLNMSSTISDRSFLFAFVLTLLSSELCDELKIRNKPINCKLEEEKGRGLVSEALY